MVELTPPEGGRLRPRFSSSFLAAFRSGPPLLCPPHGPRDLALQPEDSPTASCNLDVT